MADELKYEMLAGASFDSPKNRAKVIVECWYQPDKKEPYVVFRRYDEDISDNWNHVIYASFKTKQEALAQYMYWYQACKEDTLLVEMDLNTPPGTNRKVK